MNAAPLRRPLGCLKMLLRHSRQQNRSFRLSKAQLPREVPPAPKTPTPAFFPIQDKHTPGKLRTGFAVYTSPTSVIPSLKLTHPHLKPPPPNPVAAHHAYQIRKMDPSGARTRLFSKTNPDSARVGDVLLVTTKRAAEPFAGVCVSIRRRGIESSVLLRGQLAKTGVEMSFKVYSRNVTGIEIIKRRTRRARRARLTYLRKPKHDVGSVEHHVREWRRNRNVFASAVGKGKRKQKKRQTEW
ncbi:ribosomal protein l19 [Diaporthe amygdali]|uniref:ribosomal protein l19 n=1 Tax=Phomopsis amygdali TaxID=1214568 RepID=UPI0022FEBFD7|nr:ribosomal protein l19 [Diaporthe amygdali]KAJ0118499.1 ribosomal protein l19 [Diaporthe amygdali]